MKKVLPYFLPIFESTPPEWEYAFKKSQFGWFCGTFANWKIACLSNVMLFKNFNLPLKLLDHYNYFLLINPYYSFAQLIFTFSLFSDTMVCTGCCATLDYIVTYLFKQITNKGQFCPWITISFFVILIYQGFII